MSSIQIRIGAAIDSSVARSFVQVEQAATRANQRIRESSRGASKAQGQDAQASAAKQAAAAMRAAELQAKAIERANAMIARAEAKGAADADRRRQAGVRADMRAFDQKIRTAKKAYDAEERDIMRVAAAAERASQRKHIAEQRSNANAQQPSARSMFGREMGRRAVSDVGQMARFGMGVAGQAARGLGIDTSITGSVARNVELEKQAIDLSNSGYNPNAKEGDSARTRVNSDDIQRDVKRAADANAFSRTEAMGGLQSFVGKTGDLETGRKVLSDLGGLSKATGTDLGDMVDAAGDVSNALGEMTDKAEKAKRVSAIMKSIAGQGKLGAVEIKDLASQMAKLSSGATAFEGSPDENIALMGAFAQLARSKGGATTANIAAGSVTSMVNTLKTPARIKAFEKEGVDVVNKETGMLRNPQQILMAALAKTGGDPERMKKMYANVQGARAIEGSAQTFRQARAGVLAKGGDEEAATKAGLAAVAEEFDKLKKVAMGEGEIRESLNKALESQSAKAQKFNNRMDDVTADMQAKLTPALERAAPGLIKLAEAISGMVAWAAENPFKAIAAALGASLLKAGIATALSQGIASIFAKTAAGAGAPGAAGAMGPGGKALAVGASGLVGFGIGKALHDVGADAEDAAESRARGGLITAGNARHRLRMAETPEQQQAAMKEAEGVVRAQESKPKDDRSWMEKHSPTGAYESAALNWITAGSMGRSLEETETLNRSAQDGPQAAAEMAALKAEMAANKSAVDASASKIVAAILASASSGGGFNGIDPQGRQRPPGPWRD